MQKSIVIVGVSVLLFCAGKVGAQQPEWIGKRHEEVSATRLFRGAGSWKARGERHRAPQRWSLDVERGKDGTIAGSVVVHDSVLLANGQVRGTICGRQVSGTIVGPGGKHAVRFWGALRGKTLRGTYTDRTGESGEWMWDGPLPQ